MRLRRITPPADQPVTIDEARLQCRVDSTEEDALIAGCVDAALSWLDGQTGVLRRCIVDQEWQIDIPRLGGFVALPFPDVSAVTAEFTDAAAGAVQFDHEQYGLRINGGIGRPGRITFVAGFGSPADVPPAIKKAILLLTGYFFDVRSGGGDRPGIPREVDDLISPFRLIRV